MAGNYIIYSTTLSSQFFAKVFHFIGEETEAGEVNYLTQEDTAIKWKSCDFKPGSLTPDPRLLTAMLPCFLKQPT